MAGMEPTIEPRDVLDAAARTVERLEGNRSNVTLEEKEKAIRALRAVEEYTTSEKFRHEAQQRRRQLEDL